MECSRQLYATLWEYSGTATYSDVLAPWLEENYDEARWVREFGQRQGSPFPIVKSDDLFRLYALSRVCETLVLGFQRGNFEDRDWPGPVLTADEFIRFVEAIGLTIVRPTRYTPFHHEVVDLTIGAAIRHGEQGLTKAERIEVLVNRSFVTTNKQHEDLWPYGDTFSSNAQSI